MEPTSFVIVLRMLIPNISDRCANQVLYNTKIRINPGSVISSSIKSINGIILAPIVLAIHRQHLFCG